MRFLDALAVVAFTYGCAHTVWAGTRQRFGTSDEPRALAAVLSGLVIVAAGAYVGGGV